MARLNIVGFETGDLTECYSSSGSASVQSGTKRSGLYALQMPNLVSGSAAVAVAGLNAASGIAALLNTAFVSISFYIYASSGDDVGYGTDIFKIYSQSGLEMVHLQMSSSAIYLQYFNSSNGIASVGSSQPITSLFNTWIQVEIAIANSNASGGGSATIQWRVNGGETQVAFGQIRSAPDYIGRFSFEADSKSPAYFIDDVVIDSSGSLFPGPGQINRLTPNAAGQSVSMTAGTGTTFAEVDDFPHDGDTTYVKGTINGQSFYANVTDAVASGVQEIIKVIKPLAIVRDEGGTSNIFVRVLDSPNSEISGAFNASTTYTPIAFMAPDRPSQPGVDWTTTVLDNVQIAAGMSASVASRYTALCIMVESVRAPASITGLTVLYGSFTRVGPNNPTWILMIFGAAHGMNFYQIRTTAGGTLIYQATGTDGTNVTLDISYNAVGMINGTNNLQLFVSNDGGSTYADPYDFSVLRDDIPPSAPTSISTTPNPVV